MLLFDDMDDLLRVLHLRDGTWHRIDWASWSKFRDTLKQGFVPLPHVAAGEHHFVVCVIDDGRLRNIIPHRYLIDRDGRIADDRYFGVLSDDEIERFEALTLQPTMTEAEQCTFDALRERVWRSMLPPAEAGRKLTRIAALPDRVPPRGTFWRPAAFPRSNQGRSSDGI
jgi:hypothetical protein